MISTHKWTFRQMPGKSGYTPADMPHGRLSSEFQPYQYLSKWLAHSRHWITFCLPEWMINMKTQRTFKLTKGKPISSMWSQQLLNIHPKARNTEHAKDMLPDQNILCCEFEIRKQMVLLLSMSVTLPYENDGPKWPVV